MLDDVIVLLHSLLIHSLYIYKDGRINQIAI